MVECPHKLLHCAILLLSQPASLMAGCTSNIVKAWQGAQFPPVLLQNQDKIGNARRMKNPKKLAQSKKKPLQARYQIGNRVVLTRDPKLVEEYRN